MLKKFGRIKLGELVILSAALLLLSLYLLGSALTIGWLGSFPYRADSVDYYAVRFWVFSLSGILLLLAFIATVVRILKM
jgi:hypothetical protein